MAFQDSDIDQICVDLVDTIIGSVAYANGIDGELNGLFLRRQLVVQSRPDIVGLHGILQYHGDRDPTREIDVKNTRTP